MSSSRLAFLGLVLLAALVPTAGGVAVGGSVSARAEGHPDGEALFAEHCRDCHSGFLGSRAPSPQILGSFPPESILHTLTTGVMRSQGYPLSGGERRAIAEYLTGKTLNSTLDTLSLGYCEEFVPLGDPNLQAGWSGWGNGVTNHSFQPAEKAGLSADRVSRLELEWAFGFPDSYSAWAQPVVAGGRLFVGSQAGVMYSLDAKSGCTYWSFEADAGIRGAANVGSVSPEGNSAISDFSGYAVFFGDMTGNAYALDADNGKLLWKVEVDDHPKARVTGSPLLHYGRLYVPMSSWTTVDEEGGAEDGKCCTFRGSLTALDAASGAVSWKTYTIPEEPAPLNQETRRGTALWGPSGSAIWSSPTIDRKRGVVYAGTGNSYTGPARNSDSIIAFDMATGEIGWVKQLTPNDVWLRGCNPAAGERCSSEPGPNLDIGSAPILVSTAGRGDLLIVGQKSGVAYALDPDDNGAVVWQYRAGEGGPAGGIVWGSAADADKAYFPVSDLTSANPGGLHAVGLDSGKRVWYAPPSPLLCGTLRYGCSPAQPVGIAAIPGIVFAGAVDGGIRAFSSATGKLLWQYDTNRDFDTVNGVKANGGSLIGVGPAIVDGMVYVNSGYGTNGGRVGNVLLAFAVKGGS